jgi:L-aminopeptidase/D-esterase-like protein
VDPSSEIDPHAATPAGRPFYTAVVQGTEEAVANALAANEDMTGRDGHRSPALPRDRVARLFAG